ncbi:MAG: TPM domain-containing protein [Verrucomicrobiales bacterium]|nr:TPM domain-containing protein [Verrucomicrobiales bacterium]
MKRNLYRVLSILFVFLVIAGPCTAQMIENIDRPEDRIFIADLADLISVEGKDHIRAKADQLLTDTATPISVVTIDRMSDHVNKSLRIETFAHFLFDQWEIGHVDLDGLDPKDANKGVLLLVSKGDRKARIQLGAGWGREMDRHCQKIMDGIIIPAFKSGNFSDGIVQGFDNLEDMVRNEVRGFGIENLQSPNYKKEKTTGDYLFIAALIGLGVFTVISLAKNGSNGSAWILWAAIFGVLFFILKAMAAGGGGGGGGGGYSGGSSGGGYSGGGGASGSW